MIYDIYLKYDGQPHANSSDYAIHILLLFLRLVRVPWAPAPPAGEVATKKVISPRAARRCLRCALCVVRCVVRLQSLIRRCLQENR